MGNKKQPFTWLMTEDAPSVGAPVEDGKIILACECDYECGHRVVVDQDTYARMADEIIHLQLSGCRYPLPDGVERLGLTPQKHVVFCLVPYEAVPSWAEVEPGSTFRLTPADLDLL